MGLRAKSTASSSVIARPSARSSAKSLFPELVADSGDPLLKLACVDRVQQDADQVGERLRRAQQMGRTLRLTFRGGRRPEGSETQDDAAFVADFTC